MAKEQKIVTVFGGNIFIIIKKYSEYRTRVLLLICTLKNSLSILYKYTFYTTRLEHHVRTMLTRITQIVRVQYTLYHNKYTLKVDTLCIALGVQLSLKLSKNRAKEFS